MTPLQIRIKAFGIHLALSIIVITLFLLIATQIWYPGPLFKLEDVWQGLQILIPVDAILGPILTLLLYVPGKKGLKFDLTVIAILQVGALAYGGMLIYKQRPVAYAFVADRFEVVLASEEYFDDIPMERFTGYDGSFPLMTYVLPPQSSKERSEFLINGINIKKLAERHYPIRPNIKAIAKKSIDLDKLLQSNEESKKIINNFLSANQNISELVFLPLQSSAYESIVLAIDGKTGLIKTYIYLDPWNTGLK